MTSFPKTKEEWIAALLHQWWNKALWMIMMGFLVFARGQISGIVDTHILTTTKPNFDSTNRRIDTVDAKVERVESKVDKVDSKVDRLAFLLNRAFPQMAKASKELAKSDSLAKADQESLTGDNNK